MSNVIPPLLSNSPPPMIGAVIDDEDDEFGNFAIVNTSSYDDALSLSTLEEIDVEEIPDIPHLYNLDKDFQDRRKDDAVSIETQKEDDYDGVKSNSFQDLPEIPPDILKEEETVISDLETIVKVSDSVNPIDSEIENNNFNTSEKCTSLHEVVVNELHQLSEFDDGFADFNAFMNTPTTSDFERTINECSFENQYAIAQDDIEDDDFGDFNNYSLDSPNLQIDIHGPEKAESIVMLMFPKIEQQAEEYHEENFIFNDSIFCQLKDVTDTLALSYQWSKSNSQNFLLQALNIDTRNILYGPRWNESIPRYAATLGFTPLEPVKSETHNASNGETTSSHSEVVEQTEIPLAEFDWVGSGLTNPLEMTPKKIIEKQQTEVDIPEQISDDKRMDISIVPFQTNSDTDSIKSLKLITNNDGDKADDDFDDFSSFQSTKNEGENFSSFQSGKNESESFEKWTSLRETQIRNVNQSSKSNENFENWTSLRETHISNSKIDEPSWLKPTILTPDLPRKEVITTREFEVEEDEFTDFQTGNIQQTPIPEMQELKIEQESKVKNHSLNTVEKLSEHQSTLQPTESLSIIPEPLQPSILQPMKVENTPAAINWPNPGVTDEELHRFDMFFKPTTSNTISNSKVSSEVAEEDDWSDFISNQTTQPSTNQGNMHVATRKEVPDARCPKKEQVLVKPAVPFSQNGFTTSFVSNQYVVLNHIPTKTDDAEDEWSDFVSSQPPPESPSRVPKPSIPKLNLDWNGPPQFTSWSASITPNIITNPVSFESFQSFASLDTDLLKNRTTNKRNPSVVIQPKKNTVPSISTIPDLEFIAPKNRTWKK